MTDNHSLIRIPSIPDVVYDALRRDISHGVLRPGRISVGDLSARFGVSAVPIREALRRLEAEGLVTFQPNRSILVTALSLKDLEELFAIRVQLEALALRQATRSLSQDATRLTKLQELVERMDSEAQDDWRVTNAEFHRLLYEPAGMPRLCTIIGSLWVAVEPYLRLYVHAVQSFRTAQEQHREILEHVRSGDGGKAATVLRRHLEITLDTLRESLRQESEDRESELASSIGAEDSA